MKQEPAVIIGAVITIICAVYQYFTGKDALSLREFLESLVPLVSAVIIRFTVFAPATVERIKAGLHTRDAGTRTL